MGERIAYLRKQKRLTQAQVAEQLGISAQAVSKWESGLSCPDIMTLVPLAQVLGVSTDELLGVNLGVKAGTVPADQNDWTQERESADQMEIVENEAKSKSGAAGPDSDMMDDTEEEAAKQDQKTWYPVPVERQDSCEVKKLLINAGACAVTVKSGEDFCLETVGYQAGEVISEVEDGTWSVRDVTEKGLLMMGRNKFGKRKMIFTVPEAPFFDLVKIAIGAGSFKGDGIHAKESSLNVGAGQMAMTNFYSEATKINCGMGEITIKGEIYGKCAVECGMGSVRLHLKQPEHYGYRTSVGMGEVKIGHNRLSGIGGSQTLNPGDSNFYQINCSMGQVAVTFDE